MYRRLTLFGLALWILASTRLVVAAPSDDDDANKKIEAATESFLTAEFKKSEKTLREVLATCAKRCSPAVTARAWTYVGLVQSVGYENQAAARESFGKALELDPSAELDSELATPDAIKAFDEARAAKQPGAAAASSPSEPCDKGSPDCVAPGVGLKGDPCSASDECAAGLYCKESVCAPAPSCTRGTDCASGECAKGFCVMAASEADEPPIEEQPPDGPLGRAQKSAKAASAPPQNWVGLHVALDVSMVGGQRICARQGWNDGFRCYNEEGDTLRTNGADQPYFSSDLPMKPILAGPRVLASFERIVAEQVTAGVRAGFSFGGSPKFLPLHGELFGSYWLVPLGKPGLRPYVGAGGGVAQVDAPVSVTNRPRDTGNDSADVDYDAFKKMGQIFLRLGGGAVYDLTAGLGVQAHLSFMYFLPSTGFVVEPSLGGVVGF